MKRTPVISHNIAAAGYDPQTETLELEFANGRVYEYGRVPPDTYAALMAAPSLGRFFFAAVRGRYPEIEITPSAEKDIPNA